MLRLNQFVEEGYKALPSAWLLIRTGHRTLVPFAFKAAGALGIGARPPLIAFNVNLRSTDLSLARSIAKDIRQSNGGLPHRKAIGVELASRQMVQVAMNLTDHIITPLHVAFERVRTLAAKHGVEVGGAK